MKKLLIAIIVIISVSSCTATKFGAGCPQHINFVGYK